MSRGAFVTAWGEWRRLWAFPLLALCLGVLSMPAPADEFEDPWEDFNRRVHGFNMFTDKIFLRPVTQGYLYVTPRPAQKGIRNVFNNILELPSALNGLLQGKPGSAARDTGRFLVNSTLGLGGLFDVATHMGMESEGREDFGQTLAVWGFDRGPYVVLPFWGPSTVRDTMGLPVDWLSDPTFHIEHPRTRNSVFALYVLNRRAQLMELEEHLTGDHYSFMRDAYLQHREFLIKDGEVEDTFGSDLDMSEFDDYYFEDDDAEDVFAQ